jgi:hypothetical protein
MLGFRIRLLRLILRYLPSIPAEVPVNGVGWVIKLGLRSRSLRIRRCNHLSNDLFEKFHYCYY